MFPGLSSLRREEKRGPSAQGKDAGAMQEYLRRYTGEPAGGGEAGGKKKRKKRPKAEAAVQIVDADVTGFEGLAAAAARKRAPPGARAAAGDGAAATAATARAGCATKGRLRVAPACKQ